jgi:hypothetical protein
MDIFKKEMSGYTYHYVGHAQRKLYLGCEIEFDGMTPSINGDTMARRCIDILRTGGIHSHATMDGSLNRGRELIVHPATLDVYNLVYPSFLKMFRELNNAQYFDEEGRTGGHVHVSRRFFGKDMDTRERNVDRLIAWVFVNREAFKKFAMRDSRWARYNETRSSDKYVAINTLHDKTIEFRIFDGVKMAQNLLANLELVELISMAVATGTTRVIETMDLDALITSYARTHRNAYAHWLSVK